MRRSVKERATDLKKCQQAFKKGCKAWRKRFIPVRVPTLGRRAVEFGDLGVRPGAIDGELL